jgi:hypothetical protein
MLRNIDVLHRAVVKSCGDAPGYFAESVSAAFTAMFEDGETIPVNVDNLVKSDEADTIPAQLKSAQDAAKTADDKVRNLRDTLGIASKDTNGVTGTQQGTTNATA